MKTDEVLSILKAINSASINLFSKLFVLKDKIDPILILPLAVYQPFHIVTRYDLSKFNSIDTYMWDFGNNDVGLLACRCELFVHDIIRYNKNKDNYKVCFLYLLETYPYISDCRIDEKSGISLRLAYDPVDKILLLEAAIGIEQ